MAYTTTTRLALQKAVPGTNQAFETAVFNSNWDKVDAEAVAADTRLDAIESLNTNQDTRLSTLEAGPTLRSVAGTTDTVLAGDKNNTVVYTSSSAVTVTVPSGILTQAGNRIDFIQDGTGSVSFVAGSGVTLVGMGTKTNNQYAGATIVCVASNQLRLIGNITS